MDGDGKHGIRNKTGKDKRDWLNVNVSFKTRFICGKVILEQTFSGCLLL